MPIVSVGAMRDSPSQPVSEAVERSALPAEPEARLDTRPDAGAPDGETATSADDRRVSVPADEARAMTSLTVGGRPLRVWMFNHYAASPDRPGGTRHHTLALELNRRGADVTIFASGIDHRTGREERLARRG